MRLSRILGWGIVIYAIVALVWMLLTAYGYGVSLAAMTIVPLTAAIVAFIAARHLHLHAAVDALAYSGGWTVIAIAIDYIYKAPFVTAAYWTDWRVWLIYGCILLVPLATVHEHV